MNAKYETLRPFFDEWTKEFARAVEMFTGEKAAVSWEPPAAQDLAGERPQSFTWWKQTYDGEGSFTVWLGSPEETWGALATTMTATADQSRQAFLEMLAQAHQGAAAVLSAGLRKAVRCREPEDSDAPPESSVAAQIAIEFRGTGLQPMVVAVTPDAAQVLGLEASKEELVTSPRASTREAEPESGSEMLGRLMDIDLPLSVALGRAVLPVRDILRMTPGALIELDRDIGEFVEVLIHGAVVARGEVVSVKGNYGVRIKEIISRKDRLALRKQA